MFIVLYLTVIIIIITPKLSATNSYNPNNENLTMKFISYLPHAEKIYNKFMFESSINRDPVCLLPKAQKIALCQQIFKQDYFKQLNILPNKTAFFTKTLNCEEKPLILKSLIFFTNEIISQKMYPCYGRHEPVRTNYIIDDYYDKFYLSSSLVSNSIMVYVHKFDSSYDWFSIYTHIENVKLDILPLVFIKFKEIENELRLHKTITSNSNPKEIERIYIREQTSTARQKDEICTLEKYYKISLCKLIFDRYEYKTRLQITLNLTAFAGFTPQCIYRRLKIRFLDEYKNQTLPQQMLTCFSRSLIKINNVVQDVYSQRFAISAGPRRNSINVYLRTEHYEKVQYYLIDFLENVNIKKLEPIIIQPSEMLKENVSAKQTLKKKEQLTIKLISMTEDNYKLIEKLTTKQIQKQEQQYIENSELNGQIKNKFENIYTNISLTLYEEFIRKSKENLETKESLIFNDNKIIEKIKEKYRNGKKIISMFHNINDEINKPLRKKLENLWTRINETINVVLEETAEIELSQILDA